MKYSDIQKLLEAGLITGAQRQRIVEHFHLKEDGGKFLTIISMVGAVLIASGMALLISANWEEIPRGVKIAVGLLLMLGAHGCGYYLRDVHQVYRKSGEALHLAGSGLFLANIALIGQIYHLSSRPPNAILLWWAGIAALPWLLRSKAQHLLALLAFGLWFGMEANERSGWLFLGHSEYQILLYAMLGLVYLGVGYCLRQTAFDDFAPATEKLGLLGFHLCAYPLTWGAFFGGHEKFSVSAVWIFFGLSALALALIALGLKGETRLTKQWRWTWCVTLVGGAGLLAGALMKGWGATEVGYQRDDWFHWLAALALFVFCLLQIQVGIQLRSAFVVNLGVAFIALNIIATYFSLIGSMARTGLMFVVSGVFLIAFGVYLEKKRRVLLQQIQAPTA